MAKRNTQELVQRLTELNDPTEAARAAELRYVSDEMPGIRRKRWGRGFTYLDEEGNRIADAEVRERLDSLVIPPAWTDVWICPDPNGHILVTGRDDKGRKQYIYHPRWQEIRNQTKFNRMMLFGQLLPAIREQTDADLRKQGLPRAKVVAAVVRLLEESLIRIGNSAYEAANDSYGLTTLKDWHLEVSGSQLRFEFRGKSGKEHTVNLRDKRLAKVVKACQDIPGYELFQYLDYDGNRHAIDSSDVNRYLREVTGEDFTAKDFRTWGGSVCALETLLDMPTTDNKKEAHSNVVQAIKDVAEQLGNTPAVTRQYYIHPVILELYEEGKLQRVVEEELAKVQRTDDSYALKDREAALVLLLRRYALGI